jgi:hypothetical protein
VSVFVGGSRRDQERTTVAKHDKKLLSKGESFVEEVLKEEMK